MTLLLFSLYTFFLVIIWGFFIVSKIHAYKFKNFSTNIEKITNLLFTTLLLLSILGYIIIFTLNTSTIKINNITDSQVEYY